MDYKTFEEYGSKNYPIAFNKFFEAFGERVDKTKNVVLFSGDGLAGSVFLLSGKKQQFTFTNIEEKKDNLFI